MQHLTKPNYCSTAINYILLYLILMSYIHSIIHQLTSRKSNLIFQPLKYLIESTAATSKIAQNQLLYIFCISNHFHVGYIVHQLSSDININYCCENKPYCYSCIYIHTLIYLSSIKRLFTDSLLNKDSNTDVYAYSWLLHNSDRSQ